MTYDTISDARTIAGNAEGTLLANRYRVVRQLGQGGMGSVWLAEDTQLDNKLFAIKMLPSILVSNKRAYRQLKDEALVAMKLTHPNIVTLRDFNENNGNPFLVMDYIDGQTLDDYLAEHTGTTGVSPVAHGLPEADVLRVLRPIAAALDYAHAKGVVHRDVKPGNVMIAKDGTPYILDFGIAREIQETLTRVTGKLSSGTLLYMSPEQLHGTSPKPAQDIYSFAAMVYECLKGEPPFVRGQIEYQIDNDRPKTLPGGPRSCAAAVMAGLAKKPENRPASCTAVLEGRVLDVPQLGRARSPSAPLDPQLGRAVVPRPPLESQSGRAVAPRPPFDRTKSRHLVGSWKNLLAIAALAVAIAGGWWAVTRKSETARITRKAKTVKTAENKTAKTAENKTVKTAEKVTPSGTVKTDKRPMPRGKTSVDSEDTAVPEIPVAKPVSTSDWADVVQVSMLNRRPAGRIFVGFTDKSVQPPRNYLLEVGEKREGCEWSVVEANPEEGLVKLSKGGVEATLTLGGKPMASHHVAGEGAKGKMTGLDIARARRQERLKQQQAEAEQQRQAAVQTPKVPVYRQEWNGRRWQSVLDHYGNSVSLRDTRVFPLAEGETVTSVTLTAGPAVYVLAQDSKSVWRIMSPVVAPADQAKVSEFMDRLLRLRQSDVSDEGRVGDERVFVSISTTVTNRPCYAVPIKLLGGKSGFADLRSKTMLEIAPATVRQLSMRTEAGVGTAVRLNVNRGAWYLVRGEGPAESRRVNDGAVKALLSALARVEATGVETLAATADDLRRCGLDKPAFVLAVDVDAADAVRQNVLIGGTAPGGGRYATVGGADAVFVISRRTVADLTAPLAE